MTPTQASSGTKAGALDARLCLYLRERFPTMTPEQDADLLPTIRAVMLRARAAGFESEMEIAGFVDLTWRCDADLETLDWAAPILAQTELPASHRLNALRQAFALTRALTTVQQPAG